MDNTKNKNQSNSYKCSGCSGDMVFDPKSQGLKCIYCGNLDAIEVDTDVEFKKHRLTEAQKYEDSKSTESELVKVIHCDSCGGETILEGNNIQVACAFCGNTHTVEKSEIKGVPAESIIPFVITASEAASKYKKWIGKKIFAPSKLKKMANAETVKSVYIPFWALDYDTASEYSGERGTHVYGTRKGKDGKSERVVIRTNYKHVSGNMNRQHRDLFQPGSDRKTTKHMKAVEPFNFTGRKEYNDRFLSGFLSENYSINVEKAYKTSQIDTDNLIKKEVKKKIGGDEQKNIRVHTNYKNQMYHHFLAPILISSYIGTNGKTYSYVVNGQTGKVSGDVQLSIIKVMFAVLLAILIAGGLLYLEYFM